MSASLTSFDASSSAQAGAPLALVTGASKGIGRAIAIGLARDGFNLCCTYNNDRARAEETAEEVRRYGVSCQLLSFDVTDQAATEAALSNLLKTDVPYALINNAGFIQDGLFGLMEKSQWQRVLDVHLNGFFHVTRLLLPHMQRKREGRIVNIVSASGQTGMAGQVNYSAAKAGLIGATRALAREVGPRNILVNAVAPGFISTDMTKHLSFDAFKGAVPLARPGTPEEVAGCVRFLCSPLASYVTGQILAVNGGLYM